MKYLIKNKGFYTVHCDQIGSDEFPKQVKKKKPSVNLFLAYC